MVHKLEALDPQSLSDEIWEVPVLENFKPPLLAKIDGNNDSYDHVASITLRLPSSEH